MIQNAVNSAVGLYLVPLARYRGHRTINVVRCQDAAAVFRNTGRDVVLVDGENLAEQVVEATGAAAIRLGIDGLMGAPPDASPPACARARPWSATAA